MDLIERDIGTGYVQVQWAAKGTGTYAVDIEEEDGTWRTMSSAIKQCVIKKKNLAANTTYRFRGRYLLGDEWSDHGSILAVTSLTDSEEEQRLGPVRLREARSGALVLSWDTFDRSSEKQTIKYQVEMMTRSRDGKQISVLMLPLLTLTAVKKGKLETGPSYSFRVRAVDHGRLDDDGQPLPLTAFSAASAEFHVPSVGVVDLIGGSLVNTRGETLLTSDTLTGKIVILYFSASWCGPCRQFTPRLRSFYQTLRNSGAPVEIIFVSSDQDQASFQNYFNEMGWTAVPFTSPHRQRAQQHFKVDGIPKAIAMDFATGRTLTDQVTRLELSSSLFQSWRTSCNL